jgi:hypothetical protein
MFDRKNYHITFIPFAIEFSILNPFFSGITKQITERLSQTTNLADEIYNYGSARSNQIVSILVISETALAQIEYIM